MSHDLVNPRTFASRINVDQPSVDPLKWMADAAALRQDIHNNKIAGVEHAPVVHALSWHWGRSLTRGEAIVERIAPALQMARFHGTA